MLSLEIGELGEAGVDLSLTGFDEFELGHARGQRAILLSRVRVASSREDAD